MEGGWLGWLDGAGACWGGGGGLDKRLDGGEDGMEGAWLRVDGRCLRGRELDGGMDGVVLRFGSRGSCRVSVQRFAVFCGSQG